MDYNTALKSNGLDHLISSRPKINIPRGKVSSSQRYKQTPYRQASTITPCAYNGWEEYNGRWTDADSENKQTWSLQEHKASVRYAESVCNNAVALLVEFKNRG